MLLPIIYFMKAFPSIQEHSEKRYHYLFINSNAIFNLAI